MSTVVNSQALSQVARALGLTGAGAGSTNFTDGVLDQVLSVNELVRRGMTLASSEGVFTAVLENAHGAANTLSTTVDPYAVPVGVIPPYPSPMPLDQEVWLLEAGVVRTSGSGTISADLHIDYPNSAQGWGVDDGGSGVVASPPRAVAFWDSVVTGLTVFALQNGSNPTQKIGERLRRNGAVRFSSTSSSAATYQCVLLLGVFPIGLGQDASL